MTFQGILLFLLFLDTFHIQGDLSFPLLPDTFTEPSAAGARRESSNLIFKQIQIHIFKYIQQQHDLFSRNTKIGNIQTIFGLIYSSHTCHKMSSLVDSVKIWLSSKWPEKDSRICWPYLTKFTCMTAI